MWRGGQMRKFMKLVVIFLAVLTAVQSSILAQDKVDAEQNRIEALENAWNQGVHAKDLIALKLLLAPELIYIEYDGQLMDRDQYLASVKSPSTLPTHVASESMNVRFYGSTAIVYGTYRENGTKSGKAIHAA